MIPAAEKQKLKKQIKSNHQEVYILSLEEMDYVVQKTAKTPSTKSNWDKLKGKVEFTANYTSTGGDIRTLTLLLSDLGYGGSRAYIKYFGGKPHIVLKGYPGLRKILNATHYGVKNVKVVKMGLGKYGGIKAAKGGGILTIILLTAYRVIDYFLRDGATLTQLFGSLATDAVKVGIATGASIAAASWAAGLGAGMAASSAAGVALAGSVVVAIGPLVAVIVAGVIVSKLLSELDEYFGITDKVIAALDEISEKGIQGIIEEKKAGIVNKAQQIANDAAESIIDYAVDKVEHIAISTFRKILRNMTLPQI